VVGRRRRNVAGRVRRRGVVAACQEGVTVRRNLRYRQSDGFRTACLGERETVTEVNRNATPKIRQREGRLPVAAVGGADEVEQCLVFGNGKQLPFAEHPSRGGEVAGEHPDLSNVWLCHVFVLLSKSGSGKCPAGRSRSSAPGTAACSGGPGCRRRSRWSSDSSPLGR